MIYRETAIKILKEYVDAEESVISEFSGNFYEDRLCLEKKIKGYLKKLDAEDRYEDIIRDHWIFSVEGEE